MPNGHKQDKHLISPDKDSYAKALKLARVWKHGMNARINTPPNGEKGHSVEVDKKETKEVMR